MLTVAEKDARAELEPLLAAGLSLTTRIDGLAATATMDNVDAMNAETRGWRDHVNAVLERRFTTNDIAGAFVQSAPLRMGSTYDNATLRLARVRDAHVARVNNLSHLLNRLPVYAGSAPRTVGDGDERDYGTVAPVTINVGGSIGQLNVGETVKNLHTAIAGLGGDGAADLRTALDALTAAVGADPDLVDTQRAELLENVEFLVNAADAVPEHRKRGVIKAVVAQIGAVAATATQVYSAWQDWGPLIQQHLLH